MYAFNRNKSTMISGQTNFTCFNDVEHHFTVCKNIQDDYTKRRESDNTRIKQTCIMKENSMFRKKEGCLFSYTSVCDIIDFDGKRNNNGGCMIPEESYIENCICDYPINKRTDNALHSYCLCYPLFKQQLEENNNGKWNKDCTYKKLIRKTCTSSFDEQNEQQLNTNCLIVNDKFQFEDNMNCSYIITTSTLEEQKMISQNMELSEKNRKKRSQKAGNNTTTPINSSASTLNITKSNIPSKSTVANHTSTYITPSTELYNFTNTPVNAMYIYSIANSKINENHQTTVNSLNLPSIKGSKNATIPLHISIFFLALAAVISLYFYKKREKTSSQPEKEEKTPEENITRNSRLGSYRGMNKNLSNPYEIARRNSYINTCMKYDDEWGIGKKSIDEKEDPQNKEEKPDEEDKDKKDTGHHVRFSKLIIRREDGTADEVLMLP